MMKSRAELEPEENDSADVLCGCGHPLSSHDWPVGACMGDRDECDCPGFVNAHHSRDYDPHDEDGC